MVFMADEYQSYPGNNHTLYKEARTERGSISTYDGVVLADSVQADDGGYTREYPQGSLAAHLVGYYSQVYGALGHRGLAEQRAERRFELRKLDRRS